MSEWKLYDFVANNGSNDFEAWSKTLQKKDRGRLSQKLRMLEKVGPDLPPQLLAGPIKHYAHIFKIRINGDVALRPLLCKGPISNDEEFTLLKGAVEKDNQWVPSDAPTIASKRRLDVIADATRRCPHVRVK